MVADTVWPAIVQRLRFALSLAGEQPVAVVIAETSRLLSLKCIHLRQGPKAPGRTKTAMHKNRHWLELRCRVRSGVSVHGPKPGILRVRSGGGRRLVSIVNNDGSSIRVLAQPARQARKSTGKRQSELALRDSINRT
ncbi:MAG: hypothetical protein RL748_14 [Pseudomonadota bacterium]